MSMPAGCVSKADLVAHYAAVRKRLMRSHLKVVAKTISVPPPISTSITRPAPELCVFNIYAQEITGDCDEPPVIDLAPLRRLTIRDIARAVSEYYDVPIMEILSRRRLAKVVRPRQVTFYLCREMTLRSLPEIGRRLGGKDHTTVLHSVNKIALLIKDDPHLAADVMAIRLKLVGPWA